VVERSDGSIWFTDPSYGIDSDYEGERAPAEIDGCHVYRIDPRGDLQVVADDFVRPNGLAFSADESLLYVVDTRERHLRVFDVSPEGSLSGGRVLAECDAGSFDGLRLDETGRLWVAAHDGIHVHHPEGDLLGKLRIPQVVSNLCFGGPRLNHLFVTATSTVYTMRLNVNGLRPR
jgi:gluconolactonase